MARCDNTVAGPWPDVRYLAWSLVGLADGFSAHGTGAAIGAGHHDDGLTCSAAACVEHKSLQKVSHYLVPPARPDVAGIVEAVYRYLAA